MIQEYMQFWAYTSASNFMASEASFASLTFPSAPSLLSLLSPSVPQRPLNEAWGAVNSSGFRVEPLQETPSVGAFRSKCSELHQTVLNRGLCNCMEQAYIPISECSD